MECFACGKEINNATVCPYCGYSFTVPWKYACPNCDSGVCLLTENMCCVEDFEFCEIKTKAEEESF